MKVTVKDNYLNVRVGEPRVNAPCFQYIAPGSQIEVDGKLYKGDLYETIDTWLKDGAGNYYWSGGVNGLAEKISFNWFNQLKIQTIWDQFNERGDNAKIAILDTGYNKNNEDIRDKIIASKIFLDQKDFPGIQLVIDDQDNDVHGTRCSSLIGAMNTKKWIVGIAPACEMIVGKISIDKTIADFNYIMNGISWAIAEDVDIISISYAYEDLKPDEIREFNKQLNELTSHKKLLIFASSGNSGKQQIKAERYPASFDSCISVGASNSINQVSLKTVLSDKTTIHAPGENIESYNRQNIPTPESGTSYSTPIVAAIAALAISFLKKKNNDWDKTDLINKIYNTGDPIPDTKGKKIINPIKLFNNL